MTCNPTSRAESASVHQRELFRGSDQLGQNGPTILPAIYGPAYFNWDMGLFKNFAITERQNLQFRFNFYNWLNHPLYSFNGGNLNLSFTQNASSTDQNNSNFGITTQKQGHRIIEMGCKYTSKSETSFNSRMGWLRPSHSFSCRLLFRKRPSSYA